MIKIDLIAGFLGAGKTTFLLKYARYLMSKGLRIGILVYDYGAINVDMLLLHELRGDLCELEMVAAGCDADCLNRRFRTKLISMAMSGYDRVIVEPSGVFDMDMFFDTVRDEPLENWYEIGSVITVVNALATDKLDADGEFILASQAVCSGTVLFSRTQLSDEEGIKRTKEHLAEAASNIGCTMDLNKIVEKPWDSFTDDDFDRFANAGYQKKDYVKVAAGRDLEFSSKCYLEYDGNLTQTKEMIKQLFESSEYGHIIRVKGFVLENDAVYQINASAYELTIEPIATGQSAMIVIGRDLDEEKLDALLVGSLGSK